MYTYTRFAQAYGDGAYNSCTYNCVEGQGTANTGSGSLVNTGVAVGGVVTLACLILLAAVLVRVWRKPAKPAAQEAVTEDDEPSDSETTSRS
jgi:hypothetical protein